MNNVPLFEKFTEPAKKTMYLAREEAEYYQQPAIAVVHLLLGLMREGENNAAHVLEASGVTLERLRTAVEEAKGRGSAQAVSAGAEMGLTPHTSAVIEMAIKGAEQRFPPRAGAAATPLIGSIQMTEQDATKILQDGKVPPHLEALGVTLEEVRRAVAEAKGRGVQILIDQRAPVNTPVEAAERQQHPFFHVDTENLLLGVLQVPESTGAKILQKLGVPPLKDVYTLLYLEQASTLPLTTRGYLQRFTDEARYAWDMAHKEARRLQDSYVGGPHLLLGLVAASGGVAARVSGEMGIDLEKMRARVKPGYERGYWDAPGTIKLQPKLKKVIEVATNEARQSFHPYIGTGHLLLALLRGHDGQGIEPGLLEHLGVDLDALKAALRQALSEKATISERVGATTSVVDEDSEAIVYAAGAAIEPIERDLRNRELDVMMLTIYPFTPQSRRIVEDARLAARNMSQVVGPEHLLLGLTSLTRRPNEPVGNILKDLGIDYARTQAAIEKIAGQGEEATSLVLLHSALCRACLLLAVDEAERRNGKGAAIKSEHLLLGVLREEKGIIAGLLNALGTSVDVVREKLEASLEEQSK